MSGTAIRGQEASIRVTVQDQYALAFGLFGQLPLINVNDWTLTPRTELVEKDYIGEKTTTLDTQHQGYDFNFTVDETSEVIINIMDLIQWKEENNLPPPVFAVSATVKYRDGFTLPRTEQLIDCRLKIAERGFGGRTEYITSSVEGKARSKKTIVG
jgi:hypothetical protein